MSEFTDELKRLDLAINLPSKTYFAIEEKFKDWQPPKPQQALPVVPEFIGKLINTFGTPEDGKHINYTASYPVHQKELDWIDNHQKTWLTALLIGFRVEKPQLFYLKHIDFCKTDKHDDWFTIKHSDGPLNHLRVEKGEKPSTIDCKFTQQEIDSMQTGSYEQIPVEDGE